MLNYKLPYNKITVELTKSKTEYVVDNSKYLKIGINTRQAGFVPLFNGQDITLFFEKDSNLKITGKYFQDKAGEHYILVNSLTELDFSFEQSDSVYYLESESFDGISNNLTTLSDVKRLKPTINDDSNFQGLSGLIDSETLILIRNINVESIVHQSTLETYRHTTGLITHIPLLNYVSNITNKEYNFIFGVRCQHFTIEYLVSVFGDKCSVKTLQFDNLNDNSKNLEVHLNLGKIQSINNDKYCFTIDLKLDKLSSEIQNNIPLIVYVKSDKSDEKSFFKDIQSNFIITQKEQLLNKVFDKFVLFADKVNTVRLEGSKIIQLSGNDNIDIIYEPGNYFLKNENLSSTNIFGNLPKQESGLPYVTSFSLNVKEFLPNKIIQNLEFIYENKIYRYERLIDSSSAIVGPWKYNYDSINKIPVIEILTNNDKQFVSQEQINRWDRINTLISQNYFGAMVISKTDLPEGIINGEIRFVKDENVLYSWDSFKEEWTPVNDDKLIIALESENVRLKLSETDTGVLIPHLSETNSGILTPEVLRNYKSDFLNNLNFNLTGDKYLIGNYRRKGDSPVNIITDISNIKLKDRCFNIITKSRNDINNYEIDLRNEKFFESILTSTYSKFDNQNIFTGKVSEYEVLVNIPEGINLLLYFDDSTSVIHNSEGIVKTVSTGNLTVSNTKLVIKCVVNYLGDSVSSKNMEIFSFI